MGSKIVFGKGILALEIFEAVTIVALKSGKTTKIVLIISVKIFGCSHMLDVAVSYPSIIGYLRFSSLFGMSGDDGTAVCGATVAGIIVFRVLDWKTPLRFVRVWIGTACEEF